MKWKSIIAKINTITKVKKYAFVMEVVYPKYCLIEPKTAAVSGLRLQKVQVKLGLGTKGAVRHGIMGRMIDPIRAAVDKKVE